MIMIVDPLYRYLNGKIKTFWNRNKLINKRKLLFWKKEELGSNIIALDITKRRLLYFNQVNDKPGCLIINLKDVQSCTIKKQYHGINAGDLVQKNLKDYLKSILMHFSFKNGHQAIALSFYEEQKNKKEE